MSDAGNDDMTADLPPEPPTQAPCSEASREVTQLLHQIGAGDTLATDQLLMLVYDELRRLAHARMRNEPSEHTLQATALVHEAYLRLVGDESVRWDNRGHFFGAAALAMRRILVERARKYKMPKHGGGRERIEIDNLDFTAEGSHNLDLVVLDDALKRLEQQDPRMAQIVNLRFFAGLGVEDTAAALDISPRTVKREWAVAKAWLYQQLTGDSASSGEA